MSYLQNIDFETHLNPEICYDDEEEEEEDVSHMPWRTSAFSI